MVELVGETGTVPFARPPVEKFVPVQLVASVLVQVRLLEPPWAMVVGSATSVALTGGPTVTVVSAAGLVVPPLPLQVTE